MKHQPEDQPKNQYEATGTQYSLITKDLCLKEKDRKRLLSPPQRFHGFTSNNMPSKWNLTASEAEFVTPISRTSLIMSSFGQPEFFCKGLAKRPSNWPFGKNKKGEQCLFIKWPDMNSQYIRTCSQTFQLAPLAQLWHIHVFFFSRCLVRIGLVQ